jgi:hypothetical protein
MGIYLSTPGENEHVETLEVRGTVAKDVRGALAEMAGHAAGTRCEKHLYHAIISPDPKKPLTPEQCIEAVDALGEELGFGDNPRVVVLHQLDGRQHLHIAWSRIDVRTMKAVHMSKSFTKHEMVARDLERRFGHDRVQGAHHEREGKPRPDYSATRKELRQEQKTGLKGTAVRDEVTRLFGESRNAEEFIRKLKDAGYVPARGDRRDFVVVDPRGGEHSIARRISGMRAAKLREFLKPLDRDMFPSVKEAHALQAEKASPENIAGGIEWEDKLLAAGLQKHDADIAFKKRRKIERLRALSNALRQKRLTNNQNYTAQTQEAARANRKRKQKDVPRPHQPMGSQFDANAGSIAERVKEDGHKQANTKADLRAQNDNLRAGLNKEAAQQQDIRFADPRTRPADPIRINKPVAPDNRFRDPKARALEQIRTNKPVAPDSRFRDPKARAAEQIRTAEPVAPDNRFRDPKHRVSEPGRSTEQVGEDLRFRDPKARANPKEGLYHVDRHFKAVELSDERQRLRQRQLDEEKWDGRPDDDPDRDRQRGALGHGRSRSR